MDDAKVAVRNAAKMMAHRGVQAAGGLLFFALVPRLMGPDLYGRFALVTSLALWFALASGLGLVGVTTRYVPQLITRGEPHQVSRLVGNLLTLQMASAAGAAALYLVLTIVWWEDLNRVVLTILAGSIFLRGIATFLFAIFLGLNDAGRWAAGDALRRWLQLALVLPGFQWDGLRGAAIAILTTELIVAALGLWWTRPRLAKVDLRPDLAFLTPFLHFGLAFLGTQCLSVAFQASGEPLVRTFAGSYDQVSYFGLAQTFYLVAASAPSQLMLAFAPLLSGFLDKGQPAALAQWNRRLLRCLAAGGVVVVFGALFLSELLVPVVFGTAYMAVAPNLVVLSLAVLMLTISTVSSVKALVHERSTVPLVAGAIRLAVFWSVGPLLVDRWLSLGGCIAVVVAAAAHAGYLEWRMRDVRSAGQIMAWLVPVGIGALFLPLAWFRSASAWDVVLCVVVVAGYGAALLVLRVVTVPELTSFASLLQRRGRPASGARIEH